MKKVIAFLVIVYMVIALTACGTDNSVVETTKDQATIAPTEKATEVNVETEPETEPETVPSTEAKTTVSDSESEIISLPYISNYTAADLINYSIPEIVALMGYDFDIELCGERLVYYTSGGLCFYNDDTLPGFAFFIDEAEGDISRINENGEINDESYAKIKENILSGKYEDYDFFCIYGGAKYNDEITSDMRYVELSEILGSYELSPIIGSNAMRQPIDFYPPASVYYENVLGKISTERGKTEDTQEYSYYSIEQAKAYNPQVVKIAVIKDTDKHH